MIYLVLALSYVGLIVAVVVAFGRLRDQETRLRRVSKSVDMLVAALRRERMARTGGSGAQGDAGAPAAASPPAAASVPATASAPPAATAPLPPRVPVLPLPAATRPMPAAPAYHAEHQSPQWMRWVRDYFTGGNLIVRVGVIVLFFGVAFLLKYAADHSRLPIELRMSGVALAGVVLLALGWRLRNQRRGYALALQGAGVGVLYLCVFAALHLYQLLPATAAFALLAVIGAAAAVLAVGQNSMSLAMLGAAGGFLAPVLSASRQGNEVVLFSYYALLDIGIVAIAWFKAWRELNLLAFLFTFGIGGMWGVTRYQSVMFSQAEFFLLLFFLMFVAIAVLFAQRRAPQPGHYVDGTLIFGTPLVVMGLQAGLMEDLPFGRAYSALGFAAFYVGLAWLIQRRVQPQLRLLVESFLAVGVALATLAVPLALDGHWTAATWALEGAAIFWVGLRQQRALALVSGVGLQLAAGVAFLVQPAASWEHWLSSGFIGAVLLAAAGLLSAWNASRPHELSRRYGQTPANLLLIWGVGWWFFATCTELQRFMPDASFMNALLALFIASCVTGAAVARRLRWQALRYVSLLLWPVMALLARGEWQDDANLFANSGWLLWPAAALATAAILHWHEQALPRSLLDVLHALALWLFVAIGTLQLHWFLAQVIPESASWAESVVALLPVLALLWLARAANTARWPLAAHRAAYVGGAGAGLALVVALWSLWSNFRLDGAAAPLPYLPMLNPLDLMQGLALIELLRWRRALQRTLPEWLPVDSRRALNSALVLLVFVWLNAVLLRTLHHWAGVPYQFDALMNSTLVQSSLSIFWTVLALSTMLIAHRKGARLPWVGGATLMAVVVAKLFLVDLARVGTVERIISFLVVGVLMLVIGYYSPLPPADPAEQA